MPPEVLLATLGSEPQVVTLVYDLLRRRGFCPAEVVVFHTDPAREPARSAVLRLQEELAAMRVAHTFHPVAAGGRPVSDLVRQQDIEAFFRLLYREVLRLKQAGRRLHLSIAGGRKPMAVFGMVVAQLLFDGEDRLWHLLSEGRLLAEKLTHPTPDEEAVLIPVPVMRWSAISPVFTELARRSDPWEAVSDQRALKAWEEVSRRREFLACRLTPAEREVVLLLVKEGLDNEEIARRLGKSAKTVANQLTVVYDKFHEYLGFREDVKVDRAILIAELKMASLDQL